MIVAGGGDGTVRLVAKHLAESRCSLAILPLGTFNFLSKSLEYTNNINELFAMIKNGKTKQIDVAEVNGQIMINHTWIGVYYYLLQSRERYKYILGKSRLFKSIFNIINVFRIFPTYTVEINANDVLVSYKTCLIFIGNNESATNILNFGEHKYLSSGLLSVQIANCKNRWQFFLFMFDMMFRDAKNSNYITSFTTQEMTIKSTYSTVNTVIDGELARIKNPLHFTIRPKSLTVVHP